MHTKDELRPKFLEQFGGELSRRAFDWAWIEAGKENIAYATAGRRKSGSRMPAPINRVAYYSRQF